MTTTANATATVIAEDAPIGVLLWAVRSPEFERNYTLAAVETVRDVTGTYVRWVYQSGKTRAFQLGQRIAVRDGVSSASVPKA